MLRKELTGEEGQPRNSHWLFCLPHTILQFVCTPQRMTLHIAVPQNALSVSHLQQCSMLGTHSFNFAHLLSCQGAVVNVRRHGRCCSECAHLFTPQDMGSSNCHSPPPTAKSRYTAAANGRIATTFGRTYLGKQSPGTLLHASMLNSGIN